MNKQPDPDQEMADVLGASGSATARLELDGRILDPEWVLSTLSGVLSDERRTRIDRIVANRTYSVATVVEGIVNTGNVSAVMRSAEALGFQPFHVITGDQPYKHSKRTTQGAQKWLDVHAWDSVGACIDYLKREGYRIVVTHLDDRAEPLESLDGSIPTALVFGNELAGVSDEMLARADATCMIPTIGFVQSFNISVAAAIALHHVSQWRRKTLGQNGDLTEQQQTILRADFYRRAVDHSDRILSRALEVYTTPRDSSLRDPSI